MIIYFLEKKCKEAINLKKQYLIIGILCFLIAMGISIQIKTVKSWNTSTSMQSTAENKLKDSIFKAKEKYENTYQELQDTLKQLEEVRSTVANSSSEAGKIEAQISEINKLLGYTEVKGKGIEIEVKDGTPEKMEGYEYNDEYVNYLSNYMVHDGDLKEIVNELFNAGAEAISINGERIVSTSSISCSGNIIKVNNEKLGSPYKIKAIGLPDNLYGALVRPGGYLESMEYAGVKINVEKRDNITVNKYTGVYSQEYINRVE